MSTNILYYAPRFQFGQAGVPWALQKVACTDTCVQMILGYYNDTVYSLNHIRKDSGVLPYGTGLTVSQALQALSKNGVTHYRWTTGYNRAFMLSRLKLGPVIVATHYRYYPTWIGRCGTTNKAQIGGKTDCNFNAAHAVLVIRAIPVYSGTSLILKYNSRIDYLKRALAVPERYAPTTVAYYKAELAKLIAAGPPTSNLLRYDYLVRDPDHNSPARLEKPRYDRITETQLKRAMENITYLPGWGRPTVIYPTQIKR